jgi:hypothetical protein
MVGHLAITQKWRVQFPLPNLALCALEHAVLFFAPRRCGPTRKTDAGANPADGAIANVV